MHMVLSWLTSGLIKSRVLTMNLEYLISKWTEYSRWFHHELWERSELVWLGLIVASLVMIVVKQGQRTKRVRRSDPSGTPHNFRGL
jgi:hypothetical protein